MRSLRLLLLASTLLLPACSLARHRFVGTVRSENLRLDVRVAVDASFHEQRWNWLTDGVLFPLDAAISLFASISAFDDDRIDIWGGPGGTLLAMLLPFCTATFDGRIDTVDELQANRPEPLASDGRAVLTCTDAALQAWARGETDLRTALLQGGQGGALGDWLRSGRAAVSPIGELERR